MNISLRFQFDHYTTETSSVLNQTSSVLNQTPLMYRMLTARVRGIQRPFKRGIVLEDVLNWLWIAILQNTEQIHITGKIFY